MSCLYLSHQRFVFIKGTTLTTLTTQPTILERRVLLNLLNHSNIENSNSNN